MLLTRLLKSLTRTLSRSAAGAPPAPKRGKFWVEVLEDRAVLANFATGAAVGDAPVVRVFDAASQLVRELTAYDPTFKGGVNVALGDVTGDGTADIVTATATGAAHVKVFDGVTFREVRSFSAFPGFTGGVNVAAGDTNGDGFADVVVSVASGGSHVKAFSGADGSELASFLAYDSSFVGGVRVAVGDVDGNGRGDIVTGAGPGGNGHVKVFQGGTGALIRSFLAYPGFNGGISVGVGDLDGDGKADIVTGVGPGSNAAPHVKVFDGATGNLQASFLAFDAGFTGGVFVGVTGDANGDGKADLVVGASGTAHLKVFDGGTQRELSSKLVSTGAVSNGLAPAPVRNAAPVITSNGGGASANLSASENQSAVTTVTATDADAGTALTYSISGGADAALFTIDPITGVLAFGSAPDFENPTDAGANNVYDVTVRASDGTRFDEQAVAVTVADVNDRAPVITSNGGGASANLSVVENQNRVAVVTATDADAGTMLTYSIGGGVDAASFTIDPSTGMLRFATAPDFENPTDAGADNVYSVVVRVSDGTFTATQFLTVNIENFNDNAPVITSNGAGATAAVSVSENQTAVTTDTATDADAGTALTYSISGGADASKFTIDPSTGVLAFLSAPSFSSPTDAGANNVYDVTVRASDGTLYTEQAIAVTVMPLNQAPSVTVPTALSGALGSPVTFTASVSDPDAGSGSVTVSISGGFDPSLHAFTLSGTTGLTFTVGTGTGDSAMTFSGTVTDVNSALSNMSYTPSGYIGTLDLTFSVNDNGNTGAGGALTGSGTIAFTAF